MRMIFCFCFCPFPWPLIGRKLNMLYSSVNKTLSGFGERRVLIGNEAEFLLAWHIALYFCKDLHSKPIGEFILSSLFAYSGLSISCWGDSLMIYKLTFKVVHFRLYAPGPAILPLLEIPLKQNFLESHVGPSAIFSWISGASWRGRLHSFGLIIGNEKKL
jgi:hypothetical protein